MFFTSLLNMNKKIFNLILSLSNAKLETLYLGN
ncbi:hypothetical protein EDF66_104234 [Sphingobacterium sp. JUb20]|nr:hypothetical protein [Sphingobacterium sp. JUb21]TCR08129.1 hypothetical protein EDF66_104234 [Sphingobacterium sp. JUb20]